MNRKTFIRSLIGVPAIAAFVRYEVAADVIQSFHQSNTKKMKKIVHTAASRGLANHGWLLSRHTFSFANYYNPERMNFGVLRVLNDDIIQGGTGFGTHPHDNMEIISIPITGSLKHKDSMNNETVITAGEVQIMSAGTGVKHSEFNGSKSDSTNFLQIWVLPKEKNIAPRYGQRKFEVKNRQNRFQTVVSPAQQDVEKEGALWINQDAYFSLGNFEAGKTFQYTTKKSGNGIYVFVLEGDVLVADEKLGRRDAVGVWETNELSFTARANSEILVMEVPMSV